MEILHMTDWLNQLLMINQDLERRGCIGQATGAILNDFYVIRNLLNGGCFGQIYQVVEREPTG